MEHFATAGRNPVSTLRITPHEQDKLLRLLEADQASSKHASGRRSERLKFPDGIGVNAAISQPGGTSGNFLVRGLNLSEHGIGIIHGGYVHAGSKAVITLVTADGERFSVNGTAKRCEYVTNGVHYLGIAFDAPFDLDGFMKGINDDDGQGTGSSTSRLQQVHGRVLVLDDSAAARRLTAYLLNRIGATVIEATDIDQAKRELQDLSVDLVLADMWFGERPVTDMMDQLRAAVGPEVPVVLLTGDERESTKQGALEAGCVDVLTKPVAMIGFAACIAEHLPAVEPAAEGEPPRRIVSDLWGDMAMRPLITRFVRDLEDVVRRLDTDLGAMDSPTGKLGAYNACMRIGADAAAYGFPSIQSVGSTMCMLIDGGAEAAELQAQLVDLQGRVEAACHGL
ncbi:MAG: response regulator [Planctomycetota bacterium]